jgi:hypothetical protein
MPRTSNFVLPDADELMQLMRRESTRLAARHDYYDKHADVFDAYRELLRQAGVDAQFIDEWRTLSLEALLDALVTAAVSAYDFIAQHQTETELFDRLYEKLSPQDEPRPADAIYVFGSPHDVRIEKAIKLYKQGLAPKVILSGKGPNWGTTHTAEAMRMADIARHAGVPDEALMLEPDSLTIVDNVKRALDMFDTMNYRPNSMIIICAPYVMRRADSSWYRFPTMPIGIIRVPADTLAFEYSQDGWYRFENNRVLVLNEYAKLFIEQKMDQIQLTLKNSLNN